MQYFTARPGDYGRVGNGGLASKLSFGTSLNTVDRTFGVSAGKILADNPLGTASYNRLLRQGTEVKFISDPGMRDLGVFDSYRNEVKVNMARQTSADEVASTVVQEALHQNRFFKGAPPGTLYEEYLAFRNESLFANRVRPSLSERMNIWNDVQKLYGHLPQGRYPFGGQ